MCEPGSYVEAAKDPKWWKAMEEEMHALMENETWDLMDVPEGVKPIGCQWVYKVKYNTDSHQLAQGSDWWPRAMHNNTASIMMRR